VPIIESDEETLTKKLRELKSLLDDGIFTKMDFEAQKAKILKNCFSP